jgi:SAM-dependent methyltransferase
MAEPTDYFAGRIAKDYDTDVAFNFAPDKLEPVVASLFNLAQGGPCLEFAIGTGRVALPLVAKGLTVDGVEYSPDMIAQLNTKPLGRSLHVVEGDMATTNMNKKYSLVFLVFNTIMNLTTQNAQVECFANAARHLKSGGKFVMEVMVPDLRRYPPGASAVPFEVTNHHMGFDTYEISSQQLTSHHIMIRPDGTAYYNAIPFRYVWPSELDLMAKLSGLKLVSRDEDWGGKPFTDDSSQHVSVWEKL